MRDEYKESHPHMVKNAMYSAGESNDVVLTQLGDHFYTDEFKESHPHKVLNEMYARSDATDEMNMQIFENNEIDNYNPRA